MPTRLTTDESRANAPSAGARPAAEQPSPGSRAASSTSSVIPILAGHGRGVAVVGDLDPATVPVLESAVTEVCQADTDPRELGASREFVLDLKDVTFLDAGGLFFLARIQEQIDGWGYDLRVTAPLPAGPRRVLLLAVTRNLLPAVFSPWSS